MYSTNSIYKNTFMWSHNLPKSLYQAQAYNGTFIHSTNIYSIFAVGQTLYQFWGI